MSIDVHVPIRIRVDQRALRERPGLFDDALERALGRALARSRQTLHDRHGKYLAPVFGEPAIAWSGPAESAVSAATRRETEQRLRRIVRGAALDAGLGAEAEGAAPPLSEPPAEPVDPRRLMAFGRYRLPSYQGGQDTAVAIDGLSGDAEDELPFVRSWERAEVGNFDPVFVRQKIQGEALAQGVSLGEVYGLVVRGLSGGGWTVIVSADGFTGARTTTVTFGPQMRRRPMGVRDGRIVYQEYELVPPLTSASLTEIDLPADEHARFDQLHALMGASIATQLRDMFDFAQELEDNLLLPEELDALIAQEVDAEIARTVAAFGGRSTLLRIDWGDVIFNLALPASLAALIGWDRRSPAVLLPAVTEEQGPGELPVGIGASDDAGGAAGAGHGRRQARSEPGGGDQGRGQGGDSGKGSRYGTSGGEGQGKAGPIFPALGGGPAMVCEPFLDAEPPVEDLPTEGEALRRLVAEIAQRLDMPVCRYPATFCIAAAGVLQGRAYAVGQVAGAATTGALTMPVGGRGTPGGGNLGHATFRPVASRGIQLLRRLSQAAGRIALLRRMIGDVYMRGEGRTRLGGRYAHEPVSWVLRFEEAVSPNMKDGVGEIFSQTCQVIMLQLLDTSAQQIAARQQNIRAYAPLFRDVLIRRLADIGTLTRLRDRLRAYELAQAVERSRTSAGGLIVGAALPQWSQAAHALANACVATEGFAHLPGAAAEIVEQDGTTKIRDAHGFLWTRAALEEEIAQERGAAESIDPLIQQLSDIPETVERFRRDPASAEPLLAEMLAEMARLNAEKRAEAAADWRFGLRVGRISESSQASLVPNLAYDLAGVHLLAHEQIYPFFQGEHWAYVEGVDHVFGIELGAAALTHFFVFTGLVLLAVVCAPAAFVAGVGLAAHEVEVAEGRRDLYRALINPELVLNRTEVELECYIAYVGLALSLLPEAGTAARAISVGLRGGARRGVAVGLRLAGRSIARHVSRQVTEQLAREMLPALVQEFATNLLMEQVIVPAVVGPIIAEVEREMQVRMSVGGVAGAERLIAAIEAEARRRERNPLPGSLGPTGAEPRGGR